MSFDDPASLDLRVLFRDPAMFDSRGSWGSVGFQVFNRSSNGKIMVARHPSVRGLLFKKYTRDVAQKDQLKNYERRVEGARRLRDLIDRQGLTRIRVPRKWLVELLHFHRESSHVLIVEQLEILGDEATKRAYQTIEAEVLAQLCVVLFHFRGMDSNAKNLPFTPEGKIALIDTEHWNRDSSKVYLHHVGEYLSKDRRKMAKRIFDQLEDGESIRVSGSRGAENSSYDPDDFGEDTSSSSS